MHVQEVVDIDAAPEAVWAVMADVKRWPEWTESVDDVELLQDAPFGINSRAKVKQPRLPAATWTVTEFEDGRVFGWKARGPGFTTVGRHLVEPLDGGRARATLTLDTTGPLSGLFSPLLSGISRRYVGMEARGLKQRVEASEPSAGSGSSEDAAAT